MLIETIRVRVDADEGDDLLEALSVRGLAARVERGEGGTEVEVSPPAERWELWNLEVVSALEAWLEERKRESVVARTDRHEYVVRAPREAPARRPEPVAPRAPRDENDAARTPARAPAADPAIPIDVLTDPQFHARRPRGLVLAAGAATVALALAGLALLALLVLDLL